MTGAIEDTSNQAPDEGEQEIEVIPGESPGAAKKKKKT